MGPASSGGGMCYLGKCYRLRRGGEVEDAPKSKKKRWAGDCFQAQVHQTGRYFH